MTTSATAPTAIEATPVFVVISDDHSNHGLPIGAHVEPIEAPEWFDPNEESAWFTQGALDDEVAIDPRDLAPVA